MWNSQNKICTIKYFEGLRKAIYKKTYTAYVCVCKVWEQGCLGVSFGKAGWGAIAFSKIILAFWKKFVQD